MEAAAERACRAIGYVNAGTFEFLLGPDGSFYFIELNARLQVEHPVTELVTGIDIVREQLRDRRRRAAVARRARAAAAGTRSRCRINAEDPARDFAPAPGRIDAPAPAAAAPASASTRTSRTALDVPPHYDSLLAKLVVWDVDRPAAIERALRALRGARGRRRADDARGGARDPRLAGLPVRRVPHGLPCRDRAGGGLTMSDDHTITREEGTVTVTAGVLSHVVVARGGERRRRARPASAARARRRRRGRAARVELELAVRYGEVLPDVARGGAAARRTRRCGTMCGLETCRGRRVGRGARRMSPARRSRAGRRGARRSSSCTSGT